MNWFEVDKQGLSKLLHGRPRAVVVHELVQNAWDTGASRVDVYLRPVPGSPHVEVEVVDDDPDGFKDLSHALFVKVVHAALKEQREVGFREGDDVLRRFARGDMKAVDYEQYGNKRRE